MLYMEKFCQKFQKYIEEKYADKKVYVLHVSMYVNPKKESVVLEAREAAPLRSVWPEGSIRETASVNFGFNFFFSGRIGI